MNRESLKKWLTEQISYLEHIKDNRDKFSWDPEYDFQLAAFRLALERLEPVGPMTLEQLEKLWRGEWKVVPKLGVYDMACSKCGYSPGIRFYSTNFCPCCGAPMTDDAVQIVMQRLKKVIE